MIAKNKSFHQADLKQVINRVQTGYKQVDGKLGNGFESHNELSYKSSQYINCNFCYI